MPEDNVTQTPNEDGTATQGLTPNSGTEDPTAAAQATVASPAPDNGDKIDYKTKFSESSKEAQRLLDENRRLQAILSNVSIQRQQEQARQQQQQAQTQAGADDFDYGQLRDGILENDPKAIRAFEDRMVSKAQKNIVALQQAGAQKAQRVQSSIAGFTEAFKEPNSVLGREAMQRYQQMLYDPSYSFAMIQGDEIDLPTPAGTAKIHPHLMRMAVSETKARLGVQEQNAVDKVNSQNSFIESGSGPGIKSDEPNKFDAKKHMTQAERDYCDKINWSYAEWWKNSKPKLREARLKAGKPLASSQI